MMKYSVITVAPLQVNCSLVWCDATNKAALIDPGGETERIIDRIDDQGVELERILITHAHFDHVGAVADLAEQYNIPIEGPHLNDKFLVDDLPRQGAMFGYESVRAFTPPLPDAWIRATPFRSVRQTSRCCTAQAIPLAISASITLSQRSPLWVM